MRRHDQKRLGQLVGGFMDRCGFDPPFYSLIIGSNGSVTVAHHAVVRSKAEWYIFFGC
jgi:hypothetical protein